MANLAAYRAAFLAAAAICLCGVACSLSIRDADAAATIPGSSMTRPELGDGEEAKMRYGA